jgi:hypothetical protein
VDEANVNQSPQHYAAHERLHAGRTNRRHTYDVSVPGKYDVSVLVDLCAPVALHNMKQEASALAQPRVLPQNVRIAGFTYRIKYVDHWDDRKGLRPDDEPWGRTQHNECLIEIWDQLAPQAQTATLLHEIMHICEFVANVHLGERKLDRIATLLHGFLVDNQHVLALYSNSDV